MIEPGIEPKTADAAPWPRMATLCTLHRLQIQLRLTRVKLCENDLFSSCWKIAQCFAQVRQWVNKGGKLKVGGDVLVGLKRWETLVPKTPEVDKLLANMPEASSSR